jgi:cell division protein FtsI (penicillin-binding protein 3)
VRRVISEETNSLMIQALKTVVTAKGTAPEAAMEHYTVAGKTGTAQKSDKHGYTGKFYSSFCGFFPADNPEICIYVSLDDPKGGHYGGKTAAPIFKEIAEKAANYLNIRPDKGIDGTAPDTLPLVSTDLPPKTPPTRAP